MQIPIKIKELELESIKPENWEDTILLWENELDDLVFDPNYTHVSWSVNSKVQMIINVRQILNAPMKKRYSRKHKDYFFIVSKKDLD